MVQRAKTTEPADSIPPIIDHVTQNYVPLKSLVLATSERCGKELANILRTTENLPNDIARKDQLLRFVVACRQEYVKLYVLCKWAVVSNEISKAIDVSNWLHGQVNCFNNVVGALYHLQSGLGPAKLPWADIETAIQVLKHGGPSPPPEAKFYLPNSPLSNIEVGRVLRRLDILIALRLALHEHLPSHYRNYEVLDGRARFNLGNSSLWVELSIADEDVATQSRFFFVGCGLHGSSSLDPAFSIRMETTLNEQLATRSLVEVLDWLSMFAAVYNLRLLDAQLLSVETGAGPWASVVSHRDAPSNIKIQFFLNSTNPGQVKVAISPEAPHLLTIEPNIDVNLDGPVDNLAVRILSAATKRHAARSISSINAPWICLSSEFGLSVELSPCKFTDLTIDTTSGKFSLSGTNPLLVAAQHKLNQGYLPLDILTKLRAQVFIELVASRAEAVGWRALRNIRLAPDELVKISPFTSLLALRLSTFSDWSLCVALSGKASSTAQFHTRWFATRLECSQRRWTLGPMHDVHGGSLNLEDPDYNTLLELISIYSKQFVLFELMRELDLGGVRHSLKLKNGNTIGVVADITTMLSGASRWAQSGLLCVADDVNLRLEGKAKPGRLAALGNIKEEVNGTIIRIEGSKGTFSLLTRRTEDEVIPNQSSDNPEGTNDLRESKLQRIISALGILHNAANSLASAASLNLEVKGATLSSLVIKYAEPRGILTMENGNNILFDEQNPQRPLAPFLPAVGEHSKDLFGRIVTFLREWYPVWELLAAFQVKHPEHNLVILPQTMNWLRVQLGYDVEAASIEIRLRDFRHQRKVDFVTAINGAEKHPEISKWFTETLADGVVPLMTGCAIEIHACHVISILLTSLSSMKTNAIS